MSRIESRATSRITGTTRASQVASRVTIRDVTNPVWVVPTRPAVITPPPCPQSPDPARRTTERQDATHGSVTGGDPNLRPDAQDRPLERTRTSPSDHR
jgi:hypothetical protein